MTYSVMHWGGTKMNRKKVNSPNRAISLKRNERPLARGNIKFIQES